MVNKTVMGAWLFLGATVAGGTLFADRVAAEDREFTVGYRVSTQGLDVKQPNGADEFYARLRHAAEIVCTHGMRVDLKPVADRKGCFEKALGSAVRSANSKLVTQVYLQTHTLQEAATFGIDVPVQIAAK
jgi:UrcA family protein